MNILTKTLILSVISLLSAQCLAYDPVYFQFRHVNAEPGLQTPAKGSVALYLRVVQLSDWKDHAAWVDHDLLLGEMSQDHVKGWLLEPDVTGTYILYAHCYGKDKFSFQETQFRKTFTLQKGIREVDISFACPVNNTGTGISVPEEMVFIQKPQK